MITGFNTDVRHRDVVFHVQTEDKGTGNPCIESLVYVGGQILARKRAGYRSLLQAGEASKAVAELMERQHRAMIQQIRAGEMDEKVAAIKGAGPAKSAAPESAAPKAPPAPAEPRAGAPAEVTPPPDAAPRPPAAPRAEAAPRSKAAPRPPAAPRPEPVPRGPTPPPPAAPKVPQRPAPAATAAPAPSSPSPAAPLPETKATPSAPAAPRTSPKPRPVPPARPHPPRPAKPRQEPSDDVRDQTLDQVILEYLEMESDQDRLVLTMNRREGELAVGGDATLLFRTESSVDRDPIGQALITVRLISTIEEPQVLAEGRTDDQGELVVEVSIPELKTGSGALIISAESSIGNAETRHLI